MSNNVIGARIRALREAQGLSQARLAAVSEVDPSYLARVERGEAEPSLTTLGKVAAGLGVKLVVELGDSGAADRDSVAERAGDIDSRESFLAEHADDLAAHERAWLSSQAYPLGDPDPEEKGWWADLLLRYRKQVRRPAPAGLRPTDEVSGTQRKDAMRPPGTKETKPGKARR